MSYGDGPEGWFNAETGEWDKPEPTLARFAEEEAMLKNRCQEFARRGTGFGTCDGPLDEHGNCQRAGTHISQEEADKMYRDMGRINPSGHPTAPSDPEPRSQPESTP